jgi:hypothetical protein
MPRPWVRYWVAVLFVIVIAAPWYLSALEGGDGVSAPVAIVIVGLTLLVSPATGFLLRWLAIPLLLVPVLLVMPLGVNPQDSDQWTYWWLLVWGPMLFVAPAVIVGLVVRLVRDWSQRHLSLFGGTTGEGQI